MSEDAVVQQLSAAVAQLTDEVRALRAGPHRVRSSVNATSTLLSRWRDVKQTTLGSWECDYNRCVRVLEWAPPDGPFAGTKLGDRDPMSLTPEDADDYRVWRHSTVTRRKKVPTVATINRELMMLLRILNFAVRRRTIPYNPLLGIEAEDEDNARAVIVEEGGFAQILSAFDGTTHQQKMRAFTTLGYDSGMRKTELLLARRSWMDPARHQVHVPAAVAKNGKARVADLSLRSWSELQELPPVLGTDYIFANPETRAPYAPRYIHRLFVEAVERSGVVGRDGNAPRLHDLRRSWVTLARRRGIPESEIMAKSGHAEHDVFRRYSIVDESDLRRSWETMEAGRQRDIAELSGSQNTEKRS